MRLGPSVEQRVVPNESVQTGLWSKGLGHKEDGTCLILLQQEQPNNKDGTWILTAPCSGSIHLVPHRHIQLKVAYIEVEDDKSRGH